ncbi:DUF3034 family protein [Parvularcula sp. ZS-1/3]|uniref:DUF3034 family protein n=1 Tax=Parvularcula mediterranea TaxID=2732508 RepID=A0A7Y3W556_9PROT|nr:DUF3034 family protein [Parvularcula mediterranea]NNU16445.1 DUF3034 family protein [Parvularcula mediterranea]
MVAFLALWPSFAGAQLLPIGDSARLLATGGVSQVEGAGGGGLAAWALITGYGSDRSVGGNVHYTHILLPNFEVRSAGVAVGLYDRIELSYAQSVFGTGDTGAALGLGEGFGFETQTVGAKVRLLGDAIFDQDSLVPQISLGVQHKSTSDSAVLSAVGAEESTGTDYYIAASKLFLGQGLLVNGTVRMTRANQFGFLGYGGDQEDACTPQFEVSLVKLLSPKLAVGAEYRSKPDNLGFAKEEHAYDVFGAYFFNKNASLTLAYVQLGSIALQDEQGGTYLSLQLGF